MIFNVEALRSYIKECIKHAKGEEDFYSQGDISGYNQGLEKILAQLDMKRYYRELVKVNVKEPPLFVTTPADPCGGKMNKITGKDVIEYLKEKGKGFAGVEIAINLPVNGEDGGHISVSGCRLVTLVDKNEVGGGCILPLNFSDSDDYPDRSDEEVDILDCLFDSIQKDACHADDGGKIEFES